MPVVSLISAPPACVGYQLRAQIYSYSPAESQPSPFTLDASIRSAEALSGIHWVSLHFLSGYAVKSEREGGQSHILC